MSAAKSGEPFSVFRSPPRSTGGSGEPSDMGQGPSQKYAWQARGASFMQPGGSAGQSPLTLYSHASSQSAPLGMVLRLAMILSTFSHQRVLSPRFTPK